MTAATPRTQTGVLVSQVVRRFDDRVVLDHLDLTIDDDELVVLLGPSGCGKSTLLRLLAGLDKPDGGRIEVPANRAIVFQGDRLLPWQRVLRNVTLGLRGPDSDEKARKAKLQDSEAFKKRLASLEDRLLQEQYLTQEIEKRVTPQALKEAYNKKIRDIPPEEEVKARHILVANEADAMRWPKEMRATLKGMQRDVQSLSDHSGYLSNKITFLLDAVLGMVSLEQNNIIKIFSVAAVVFMPPTLVASIYGMNFKHMPELDWTFGYPLAVVLMILAAVLPYLLFKWKRWL